jgi:hypothetical protein
MICILIWCAQHGILTPSSIILNPKQVQEGLKMEKKQNNLQQVNVEQQEKEATNKDLLNRKKMGVIRREILGD